MMIKITYFIGTQWLRLLYFFRIKWAIKWLNRNRQYVSPRWLLNKRIHNGE